MYCIHILFYMSFTTARMYLQNEIYYCMRRPAAAQHSEASRTDLMVAAKQPLPYLMTPEHCMLTFCSFPCGNAAASGHLLQGYRTV